MNDKLNELESVLNQLEDVGFRLVLPGDAVDFIDHEGREVGHLTRIGKPLGYVVYLEEDNG